MRYADIKKLSALRRNKKKEALVSKNRAAARNAMKRLCESAKKLVQTGAYSRVDILRALELAMALQETRREFLITKPSDTSGSCNTDTSSK